MLSSSGDSAVGTFMADGHVHFQVIIPQSFARKLWGIYASTVYPN